MWLVQLSKRVKQLARSVSELRFQANQRLPPLCGCHHIADAGSERSNAPDVGDFGSGFVEKAFAGWLGRGCVPQGEWACNLEMLALVAQLDRAMDF